MRELRNAEQSTLLSTFGAGMLKGRGFGAAYAPATKDAIDATEVKADKRRAYEDARERTALELGLKKGTREYDEWKRQYDAKQKERELDYAEQERRQKRGDTQVDRQNEYGLKQRELDIRAEANRIAERARLDGNKDRYIAALGRLKEDAWATASKSADEKYGVVDSASLALDPDKPRKKADYTKQVFNQLFGTDLQAALTKALHNELGIKSIPSAPQASGRVVRGEIK
jgi:hypothetical protein